MDWFIRTIEATWSLTAEMAPYLLLGFAVAGLLHVTVPGDFIRKHLGQRGPWQSFKAAVIGVPLPLCSCGILPVAASLRAMGGSRGAVASFTASTPQTGVDSILATGGILGWTFAGIRVVVSILSGTLVGLLVEKAVPESRSDDTPEADSEAPAEAPGGLLSRLGSAFRYGFVHLPGMLARSLVLGLVLAGLLTVLMPENWVNDYVSSHWAQYFAVLLFALPLYVCSTGSIPLALTLVSAGMSAGAALVFLVVGPATNLASFVTMGRIIGRRATVVYVLGLSLMAVLAGVVIDAVGLPIGGEGQMMEMGGTWWEQTAAVLLLLMVLPPLLAPLRRLVSQGSGGGGCCGGSADQSACCRNDGPGGGTGDDAKAPRGCCE